MGGNSIERNIMEKESGQIRDLIIDDETESEDIQTQSTEMKWKTCI
jgi:hypothetical protein